MKKIFASIIIALLGLLITGCTDVSQKPANTALDISQSSVYTKLLEDQRFASFVSLIEKADLEHWLNEEKNITLFAPTNEAISPFLRDKKHMSRLIRDPEFVIKGVRNHVLPKAYPFKTLSKKHSVFDTNEKELSIITGEEHIMLNGKIEVKNNAIEAANGYIYPITGTLMPE